MSYPPRHNDHLTLAAVARHLHAQRAAHYPRMVAEGALTRRKAIDGLRIMRTIARCWRAIAALQPEPFGIHTPDEGGAWPFERVQHLTICARHARAAADAAPADDEGTGYAEAVNALLWWETQTVCLPVRLLADINIEFRRARAARSAATAHPRPASFKDAA